MLCAVTLWVSLAQGLGSLPCCQLCVTHGKPWRWGLWGWALEGFRVSRVESTGSALEMQPAVSSVLWTCRRHQLSDWHVRLEIKASLSFWQSIFIAWYRSPEGWGQLSSFPWASSGRRCPALFSMHRDVQRALIFSLFCTPSISNAYSSPFMHTPVTQPCTSRNTVRNCSLASAECGPGAPLCTTCSCTIKSLVTTFGNDKSCYIK